MKKLKFGEVVGEKRLRELYLEEKRTTYEIAEMFGYGATTVGRWMDRYSVPRRKGKTIYPNLSPNPTLSYILGVIKGDGCVFYRKHEGRYTAFVCLEVLDEKFAQSFRKALAEIGLHPSLYVRTRTTKWMRFPQNVYRVTAFNNIFCNWFSRLTLSDIDRLLSSDEKNSVGFVRGLYESEGCLYLSDKKRNYHRIRISMYDKELIFFLGKLIKSLGFHPKIDNRANYYSVNLNRQSEVQKFLELIQPCIKSELYA